MSGPQTIEARELVDDELPRATHADDRVDRRGVALMVVLTLVASGLNYLSSLVFSRILDPIGFGELTTLLALSVIIAMPTGAAQTVIAERVAVHSGSGRFDVLRYSIRHAFAHVGTVALALTVVYVL